MRLGILGLPAAGKTTVFNALTGSELPTGALGSGPLEVHSAVVAVPDVRVEALSKRFSPRKTTFAKVTYADIAGLQARSGREGLPSAVLNQLQSMDALLLVLRAFEDPNVAHPAGSIDPERDLATLMADFLLNDMLLVEHRLERLAEMRQKGGGDRAAIDREMRLFERLEAQLNEQRPLRELGFSGDEERMLSGYGLMTRKKALVVVNLPDGETTAGVQPPGPGIQVLPLQGRLEMEIGQLPPDEREAFLAEFGIQTPGRERVIQASYELLELVSFFTMNEEELRAWNLLEGGTALDAAGMIHSDMARGFIRAEVIGWEDLIEVGGLSEARAQGRLRLEGKGYRVADGEVLYIRFNV